MREAKRPSGAAHPGDASTGEPAAVAARPPGARVRDRVLAQVLLDRCDEGLVRRALRARPDLRIPHGTLVACGTEVEDARAAARAVAGRVPRALLLPDTDGAPVHAAVIVPVPAPASWRHALEVARLEGAARDVLVLVRPPVLGLRGLRVAYHRAVADAGLALAAGPAGPLVLPDDLVIQRMLVLLDAADQRALATPIKALLALPAVHRDAYLHTLDVLRRTGGAHTRAAGELHLHVNTVRYRIDRIEEMTGLRLADPADRLAIDLAVMLVRLRGLGVAAPAGRALDFHDAGVGVAAEYDYYESPDLRFDRNRPYDGPRHRPPRPGRGTYTARVVPKRAA
jgi:hypothetical protein